MNALEMYLNFHFSVFPVPIVEGYSSNQLIDSLKTRLGIIGAEKAGSWIVECEAFHSVKQSHGTFDY